MLIYPFFFSPKISIERLLTGLLLLNSRFKTLSNHVVRFLSWKLKIRKCLLSVDLRNLDSFASSLLYGFVMNYDFSDLKIWNKGIFVIFSWTTELNLVFSALRVTFADIMMPLTIFNPRLPTLKSPRFHVMWELSSK